jgi:hypothetical protein
MSVQRPTIIAITGAGRSGSTILAKLLGEVDGIFAAGESSNFWMAMGLPDWRCSCRLPVNACPVWGTISVRRPVDTAEAQELMAAEHSLDDDHRIAVVIARVALARLRQLPHLARLFRPSNRRDLVRLARRVEDLYGVIAEVTGCPVIVDSSKQTGRTLLLRSATALDVRTVHLIRDVRGVAHSWRRYKQVPSPEGPFMQRISRTRTTIGWLLWNAIIEALLRRKRNLGTGYLLIRYEDLVNRPEATLRRILIFVGKADAKVPVEGHGAHLGEGHLLAGNPDRYVQGDIALRLDEAWVKEMPRRVQFGITVASAPMLIRYGYSLRPGRPERLRRWSP